jgi:hypothetical protein
LVDAEPATLARFAFRTGPTSFRISDAFETRTIVRPTCTEAGYAEVRKEGDRRRRRTLVTLAPQGRTAFDSHVEALRQLVSRASSASGRAGDE